MLPVVRGDRETARQIVLYSIAMVAFTDRRSGYWLGPLYTAAAVVLGVVFVALAVLPVAETSSPRRASCSSTTRFLYLALLFVAAARSIRCS